MTYNLLLRKQLMLFCEYGKLSPMDQKTLNTLEYPLILSVLADQCHFNPARERALKLQPLSDLRSVQALQDETAEAQVLLNLHPGITVGGARDLRSVVADATRGIILEPSRLLEVKDTLVAARNLKRQLGKMLDDFPVLAKISGNLADSLGLVSLISKMISDQGEVLDSASRKLTHIRKDLKIRHDSIKHRMNQMLKKPEIARYLQEPIITQRNGRYVLPIKADDRSKLPGIVHDQSASGATVYIEPQVMVERNNLYRKLELDERDEIQRILTGLTLEVAQHEKELLETVETLINLDLVLARGRVAMGMNAARPILHPFPKKMKKGHPGVVLRLFAARHPLLLADEVVPIDVALEDETYALIITGPNTGGKTVTLKTVGLLVCMAQTGLHIPAAAGSELSLFKKVFADIGDEQSIEQSLSTFSGHITNIIKILKEADRQSLVVLDELGAGTDPQEGAALARSLMSHLLEKGITTLVTTHHPDLKAFAHTTPGVINASVEFDLESLRPTYHLTVGLPGRSNALAIASRLGMSDHIVKDARKTLDPGDLKADDLLDDIHRQRKLAEEARQAAERAREEAEKLRSQLADRLIEIEDENRDALQKARLETQNEIQKLQEELEEIKSKLKQKGDPREEIDKLEEKTDRLEEQISQPLPQKRWIQDLPEPSGPIEVGNPVYLRSLGKRGLVLSLIGDDVEVQIGNVRVRAQRADLEYLPPEDSSLVEQKLESTVRTPKDVASPGFELDLRGQQVDEALENLGFYLDKAFLAGLPWARIIHGMGTGRLRGAVRKALHKHPQIKSFEPGKENEGGDGVTVVSFQV
jgi:DNA mismatch repair protein MutS2